MRSLWKKGKYFFFSRRQPRLLQSWINNPVWTRKKRSSCNAKTDFQNLMPYRSLFLWRKHYFQQKNIAYSSFSLLFIHSVAKDLSFWQKWLPGLKRPLSEKEVAASSIVVLMAVWRARKKTFFPSLLHVIKGAREGGWGESKKWRPLYRTKRLGDMSRDTKPACFIRFERAEQQGLW